YVSAHHRYLPSFPTRRSSDLVPHQPDVLQIHLARKERAKRRCAFGTVPEFPVAEMLENGFAPLRAAIRASINRIDIHRRHDISVDRKSTRLNSSHLVISYAVF